jgi:hypothetical protein
MTRHATVLLCLLALAALPATAQFRLPLKLSELEQQAKADSNDPAAHFNVALAYWNAKRWNDVERELRLAVMIEPQFAEGWLALSRLPFAKRSRLWDEMLSGACRRRFCQRWRRPIASTSVPC